MTEQLKEKIPFVFFEIRSFALFDLSCIPTYIFRLRPTAPGITRSFLVPFFKLANSGTFLFIFYHSNEIIQFLQPCKNVHTASGARI